MRYKGAIFDMDGVLFDTERIYQQTWQEIAAKRGLSLADGFLQAVSGTNGAHMRHVIEEYYHVSDGAPIIEQCMLQVRQKLSVHVPMKKGVREILSFFREHGIDIAVASSSAAPQIESNLQMTGIRDYFSEIISGTEVTCGKPAPDIFLLAAKRLGHAPNTCFVFEDSENGIKAGHAAGCFTVMVPDLIAVSPAIEPLCSIICTDLDEAKEKIRPFI